MQKRVFDVGGVEVGGGGVVLMAGPCAVEGRDMAFRVCDALVRGCFARGIEFVYKASFDKANRMSVGSERGVGIDEGLEVLAGVKERFGVPVVTDVHDVSEVERAAEVSDVLQIPAFLCRQTDLIVAAGRTGRAVNIKKGQFMAPGDMKYAAEKVLSTGNERVMLTERGVSFGYGDIVLDPRSLVLMGDLGWPVVLDVTHTTQRPGAEGGSTGGDRRFTPYFVKLGMAFGVAGIYMEVHPDPDNAISDRGSQIPLDELDGILDLIARTEPGI